MLFGEFLHGLRPMVFAVLLCSEELLSVTVPLLYHSKSFLLMLTRLPLLPLMLSMLSSFCLYMFRCFLAKSSLPASAMPVSRVPSLFHRASSASSLSCRILTLMCIKVDERGRVWVMVGESVRRR